MAVDTRGRPKESAPLIVAAIVLGVISRCLAAWAAIAPDEASSWDLQEGTAESLAVFAWLVAVPALVCAIVGIYRLARNVDRAALSSFADKAPARTGYEYTGVVYATPAPPAADSSPATTPDGVQ